MLKNKYGLKLYMLIVEIWLFIVWFYNILVREKYSYMNFLNNFIGIIKIFKY